MSESELFYFISDKMLYAVLCGFIVGIERIFNDSSSNNSLKTLILVCVGSMLFTVTAFSLNELDNHLGRIIGQIITGIGFLGAGVILHRQNTVSGLTTAAFIWFLASIGVIIALGYGNLSVFITLTLTIVITAATKLEEYLRNKK